MIDTTSDFEKYEAPNHEKYESKNVIAQYMINQFRANLCSLIDRTNSKSVHEVGCGEGYLSPLIYEKVPKLKGSDLSPRLIDLAKIRAEQLKLPIQYSVKSIYDLNKENDSADLIVCCEVLEHIDHPDKALNAIRNLDINYAIFSVPREPLWRVLNCARGKYLSDLGNTPGHIQHWSQSSFVALLKQYFEIVEVRSPIPWTMVLVKKLVK